MDRRQLVSMAIVGALTGVGLWLAGVQSPLAWDCLRDWRTSYPISVRSQLRS